MSTESKREIRIVSTLSLLYITLLGLVCYLKFETFQYTDFDLAVHTQSLHNMLNGSLDCSILGIPYPGNHMAIALLLIAPFYFLISSPLTLLLFQTVALAAGAVAVLLYARNYLPRPYPAIVASLYLLYPPLIYMNLYEFHPVALATTFLLFALLAYDRSKPRSYALFLLLAMACQENISLVVIMLGIKALFERRRAAWVIWPIAAGAAWFAICLFWIMPHFNPGIIEFSAIYKHLRVPEAESLQDVAMGILTDPMRALTCAFQPGKLLYLASMLLPLALTSLLAPLHFLPALPVIAQRLLSGRGTETTMLFHYQAELIPFIFVSAIHGLHRLGTLRNQRWQHAAVVCMVALTILSVDMSQVDEAIRTAVRASRSTRPLNLVRNGILKRIPDDANVTATFRYLPKLAARPNLHSLHHIYSGFYTISETPYPLPEDQDFILMDTDDPLTFATSGFHNPTGHMNLLQIASANDMQLVAQVAPLLLFGHTEGSRPVELITSRPAASQKKITAGIPHLDGINYAMLSPALMRLSLRWITGTSTHNYAALIMVKRSNAADQRFAILPGKRFNPPHSWPTNSIVSESHTILLDHSMDEGDTPTFSVGVYRIP